MKFTVFEINNVFFCVGVWHCKFAHVLSWILLVSHNFPEFISWDLQLIKFDLFNVYQILKGLAKKNLDFWINMMSMELWKEQSCMVYYNFSLFLFDSNVYCFLWWFLYLTICIHFMVMHNFFGLDVIFIPLIYFLWSKHTRCSQSYNSLLVRAYGCVF